MWHRPAAFRHPLIVLAHTGSCRPRVHGSAQASAPSLRARFCRPRARGSVVLARAVLSSLRARFCRPRVRGSVVLACAVPSSSRAQFCRVLVCMVPSSSRTQFCRPRMHGSVILVTPSPSPPRWHRPARHHRTRPFLHLPLRPRSRARPRPYTSSDPCSTCRRAPPCSTFHTSATLPLS